MIFLRSKTSESIKFVAVLGKFLKNCKKKFRGKERDDFTVTLTFLIQSLYMYVANFMKYV